MVVLVLRVSALTRFLKPSLVHTVHTFAAHEKSILDHVTALSPP